MEGPCSWEVCGSVSRPTHQPQENKPGKAGSTTQVSDSESLRIGQAVVFKGLEAGLGLYKRKAFLQSSGTCQRYLLISPGQAIFHSVCCTLGPAKGVAYVALAGASSEWAERRKEQGILQRSPGKPADGPSVEEVKCSSMTWFTHLVLLSPTCYPQAMQHARPFPE